MAKAMDALTFEQALERLDAVVRDLENTETGLDHSLARYEEGVVLLRRCRAILDEAERKIRLLTGLDSDGTPVTKEFDAKTTAERDAQIGCEPGGRNNRNVHGDRRRGAAEPIADRDQLF